MAVSVEVSADGSSFTKLTDLDPAKEIRYNVTDASRASKVALCVTPGNFTSTKVVEFEVYGKDATGQGVDDTVAGGLTVARRHCIAVCQSLLDAGRTRQDCRS